MLDIQYTLEKLAEYRELGHREEAAGFDEARLGGSGRKRVRYSFLTMLSSLIGR
ncbi:hypothetical protein [Cohnella hashimotonis]|uniref:Uncharacterized protein n=1 Tax=Cohnella hashimotonis TaxID=2826895 RepID=A0ABT6TFS3_9BACL|nr:hypothetical protein [Cohnella hashimotonis]MDI4645694.1 hypothetical protein [Cohnella hashimotonis]